MQLLDVQSAEMEQSLHIHATYNRLFSAAKEGNGMSSSFCDDLDEGGDGGGRWAGEGEGEGEGDGEGDGIILEPLAGGGGGGARLTAFFKSDEEEERRSEMDSGGAGAFPCELDVALGRGCAGAVNKNDVVAVLVMAGLGALY